MTLNYDEEIDLRPYILTIVQRWWLIALIAAGLSILALIYSLTQAYQYRSTATLLITRSRQILNLAQQFPTVSEPVDTRSRMDAILSIAQSDEVVLQVIQTLQGRLPQEYQEINDLKGKVTVNNRGDIVQVTATVDDPQLAAEIANTWAQQTVLAINNAYSGERPLAEIQNQLQTAQKEYEEAQSALEVFIQENRISLITEQASQAETLLGKLSESRAWKIAYYTSRQQAMEELRVRAEALKNQLQTGNRSTAGNLGDALAVLLARAESLGVSQQITPANADGIVNRPPEEMPMVDPFQFDYEQNQGPQLNIQLSELQISQDTASNYAADLDSLITLSEEEIIRAQEALNELQQEIVNGQGEAELEPVASQIRVLETQLEGQRAQQRELTSRRDLAWNAYSALAEKEAELRNATQANQQVALASQAVPPQKPISRGTLQNTLIGGMLGLILGTALVLAGHWWRSYTRGNARSAVLP